MDKNAPGLFPASTLFQESADPLVSLNNLMHTQWCTVACKFLLQYGNSMLLSLQYNFHIIL